MPTGRDYVRSWGCANLTPAMRRGFLFEGWYRPLSVVSEISNQTLDARLAHSSELALIGTELADVENRDNIHVIPEIVF